MFGIGAFFGEHDVDEIEETRGQIVERSRASGQREERVMVRCKVGLHACCRRTTRVSGEPASRAASEGCCRSRRSGALARDRRCGATDRTRVPGARSPPRRRRTHRRRAGGGSRPANRSGGRQNPEAWCAGHRATHSARSCPRGAHPRGGRSRRSTGRSRARCATAAIERPGDRVGGTRAVLCAMSRGSGRAAAIAGCEE